MFTAEGGFACMVLLLLRAMLYSELGFVPPSMRCLAFDFAGDPPRPPQALFPEIQPEVWARADFSPAELYLLRTDFDLKKLAQRIQRGDDDVAWLGDIVPVEMLERYSGTEACQIPNMTRFFLAYWASAFDAFNKPWTERLREHLRALRPDGDALHALTMLGVPPSAVAPMPAHDVNIFGSGGGTGGGGGMVVGVTSKWLAMQVGLDLKLDGVLIGGHYRQRNGHEDRKDALAHALDLDLTASVAMDAVTEFPLGPGTTARVEGKLFNSLQRLEAYGRYEYQTRGVLAAAARFLRYTYFTRAGYQQQKDVANDDVYPALRTLSAAAADFFGRY
jgi:SAM-dependent methyltransferase